MTAHIRVGTASWTDHKPFYPAEYVRAGMKSQRISYYARNYATVNALEFQDLLGQKVGQGAPLPEGVDPQQG